MDDQLRAAIAELGHGEYVPGSSATAGYTYNPLPFDGCQGIPCHRPSSPERWAIIAANTVFEGKTVLDVGCATGYFSFKAQQAGARKVFGVDHDPKAIAVCEAAAVCYGVTHVKFGVCGAQEAMQGDWDVAFAFAVLNWLPRSDAEMWLRWAAEHVCTLWIEMPFEGDGRAGASWLHNDNELLDWLIANWPARVRHDKTASAEVMGSSLAGSGTGIRRSLVRCT